MLSILIHGGNQQERVETALDYLSKKGVRVSASASPPFSHLRSKIGEGCNLIKVGEERAKIGIKEIKTLLPHLHVKLTSKMRGLAIFEAQRLTIAAQNSLLKTLEEPPAHLMIVLTVPNPKLLLPTVVSRCQVIGAPRRTPALRSLGEGGETQNKTVEEIFATQGGQRLAIFEEKIGYNQENVLAFLDGTEIHLKECLNPDTARLLIKLWKAKNLLRDESANTKLIIDEFLFSW